MSGFDSAVIHDVALYRFIRRPSKMSGSAIVSLLSGIGLRDQTSRPDGGIDVRALPAGAGNDSDAKIDVTDGGLDITAAGQETKTTTALHHLATRRTTHRPRR